MPEPALPYAHQILKLAAWQVEQFVGREGYAWVGRQMASGDHLRRVEGRDRVPHLVALDYHIVRELFSLEGRPPTEHFCQYSSEEGLLALMISSCRYV